MTTLEELEKLIRQADHAVRVACQAHFDVLNDNLQAARIQNEAASRLVAVHRTQCQMLVSSLMNHLRNVEPTDGL